MRGRRLLPDILRTRPEHAESKKGTSGQVITLKTNYFRISKKPDWAIYQYRVDFAPDVEITVIRKALLRPHKDLFVGYLFDGTMLFTTTKLETESKTIVSTKLDGTQVVITIRYAGHVEMTAQSSIQILNLILRKSMEGLKLQLVGRNFFDAIAKVSFF